MRLFIREQFSGKKYYFFNNKTIFLKQFFQFENYTFNIKKNIIRFILDFKEKKQTPLKKCEGNNAIVYFLGIMFKTISNLNVVLLLLLLFSKGKVI